jgi:hypothetical protein
MSQRKYVLGTLSGVLFGLPFLLVGIGASGYALYTLWAYVDAQHWVETPAWLGEVKLGEYRSQEGGQTLRAEAAYIYEFNGRQYTGNRVGLWSMQDNIGSWQQDAHDYLLKHYESGRPVPCYVNPAAPEQALLFRDLRYGLLAIVLCFALVFGGAGVMFVGGSLKVGKSAAALAAGQQQHPEEPWLWNPEWAGGRITSRAATGSYILLGMAIFWLLLSAPVTFVIPRQALKEQQYTMLLLLIFPLAGIGMLVSAVAGIVRARRFGGSVFALDTPTGLIGGYLSGTVIVAKPMTAEALVLLKCQEEKTTGHGKNRRTGIETLWQDEQTVSPQVSERFGNEGTLLPVQFAIPSGLPPVNTRGNERIRWVLRVEASMPGPDYLSEFDVPVYVQPGMEGAAELAPPAPAPLDADSHVTIDPRTVRIDFFKDGTVFTYPRARHLYAGVFLLGFAAFFSGFVAMLYVSDALPIAMLLSIVVLMLAIGGFSLLINKLTVDVKPSGVDIHSDYVVFSRERHLPAESIQQLETNSNMKIGNDDIYRILITSAGGAKITAGNGYRSRRMAEQVVELMRIALAGAQSA